MRTQRPIWRVVALAASLTMAGAMFSGCGAPPQGSDSSESSAAGVPFGTSKEEYIAAFKDVEPVELTMQLDGPLGSVGNTGYQTYMDAVTEWSGGKITFNAAVSYGFVPAPLEWDDALSDGRLSLGKLVPSYEPEVYPLLTALHDSYLLNGSKSTTDLAATAWMMDVFFSDESYGSEMGAEGMVTLIPATPVFSPTAMFCKDDRQALSDFSDALVSSSGLAKNAQVEAVGGQPVSMVFSEQYEGLQRGLINCAATGPQAALIAGIVPLAPFVVLDPDIALARQGSSFAISKEVWAGLPLVAQQLLWDRLDTYLMAEANGQSQRMAEVFRTAEESGGAVNGLDEQAQTVLTGANEKLLQQIGETGDVDLYRERSAYWTDVVENELGFGRLPASYDEFFAAGGLAGVDLQPWVDRLFKEVLLEHRPA